MDSQSSCNSTPEQFNVLCRICFKENDQRAMINRYYTSLLLSCLNIDIKSNSDNSLESCIVCSKCVSGLREVYAFKMQIEDSSRLFKKYLDSQNSRNSNNRSNEIGLERNSTGRLRIEENPAIEIS